MARIVNEVEFLEIDAKSHIPNFTKTQIEKLIANYNSRGFSVQSVTPITSGENDWSTANDQVYGISYGFTSYIMIVFQKEE